MTSKNYSTRKGGTCRFIIFVLFLWLNFALANSDQSYVILISWDGCRWDYIDRGVTPNLQNLIRSGVKAKSLKPSFPTKTFPNHYSIVTGQYPENHGIIFNSLTNFKNGESYRVKKDDSVRQDKWYKSDPIWHTAKKHGIKSGSVFWVGSEVYNKGPDYVRTYDHFMPHRERIEQIGEWLNLPENKRPQLLFLYFADLDDAGHKYGPSSHQVDSALAKLDNTLGDLLQILETKNLLSKTNILLVSDHGMIKTEKENSIDLKSILEQYTYKLQGYDPIYTIFANQAELKSIYNTLKSHENGFKAYWKEDFPERFHFSNNDLIGDIIILADAGYYFSNKDNSYSAGMHGYDNDLLDMHGIFVACGPSFKNNYITDTILNIDIYALICSIMEITPDFQVDSDLSRIKNLLK